MTGFNSFDTMAALQQATSKIMMSPKIGPSSMRRTSPNINKYLTIILTSKYEFSSSSTLCIVIRHPLAVNSGSGNAILIKNKRKEKSDYSHMTKKFTHLKFIFLREKRNNKYPYVMLQSSERN